MGSETRRATDGTGSSIGSNDQRGDIMPLMAIMLIVLLGAAAMAVDLGWLFWQSIEIQHGADAAALAGVVYEPSLRPEAHTEGMAAAAKNRFVDISLGGPDPVQIIDFVDDPTAVDNDNQLRATVTHSVPTFFMKVFGLDSVAITRTAVAEYVLPIALGSPDPILGADPSTGFLPGYFLNVQGTWTKKDWGDRFGAGCSGGSTGQGCAQNPEFRQSVNPGELSAAAGYLYGIDMPEGATNLALEIFDGRWYDLGHDKFLTGDEGTRTTTWYMLFGPDATPLDTEDGNDLLCVVKYDPALGQGRSYDVPGWDDVNAHLKHAQRMGTTEPVGLKRCSILDVSESSSRYRSSPPVSAAGSRGHCNTSASFSDGVIPSRVCRGRPLSDRAASSRSAWVSLDMLVLLGKYWRSRPLVFSFEPRCHGDFGSQK